MKKLIYQLLFAFALCIFASCIAPADPLKVPEPDAKLVIDGTFTDGEFFKVILYKSKNDGEKIFVENAEVAILSEDDELLETLTFHSGSETNREPCYASLVLKPEVGTLYKIRVETANYGTTTAESFIPLPSGIEVGNFTGSSNIDVPGVTKGLYLQVGIKDVEVSEKNYFHISFYHLAKVVLDGDGFVDPIEKRPMVMKKRSPFDPGILYIENRSILLTDNSFVGGMRNFVYLAEFDQDIISNLADPENLGSILVELRTVHETFYEFLVKNAVNQQENPDDPRQQFPNQINDFDFTNINNGLGLFSGFSTKSDTILIER